MLDTKKRSLTKTILWRIIATLNSFLVLLFLPMSTAIIAAITMNITGFGIYYLYERMWNKIKWGRIK